MHDAPNLQAERRGAPLPRLKKRSEFLAAASGRRFHTARMTVQSISRAGASDGGAVHGPRFGLTVTRKTGGAVERNRIRRRLREALRRIARAWPASDIDVVVIARRDALTAPFLLLIDDLERAMRSLGRPRGTRPPSAGTTDTPSADAQTDRHSTATDRP
ncbi:ribonuclease P protein component [Chelatococcus sp. SYSU_G07232]|uniref:Ribonuclease P protein component n=1 Tax=Chelatococcus albus TaxID=3047466 RepID=A0ABT7AE96_9HYPH|nr:ribonuclease P protein component [Chelatococcus sp. SYSU_G07232]MDJ1157695.1 ribonuclease P protein component [Chelatococcus sp. SYSU_G07232]